MSSLMNSKLAWSLSDYFQVYERKSIKTGATHQAVGKVLYMSYLIPTRSTRDNVLVRVLQKERNQWNVNR